VIVELDADLKKRFRISHFDHALLVLAHGQPQRRARMSDIARALWLEPSNLTYRVTRLERLGFVTRKPDPADRRVSYAQLSEAGARLLREAWPVHRQGIRRYFLDHVRPEHPAAIAEALAAVVQDRGLGLLGRQR
jgi:DNA-binding MarR family transcriptional regulator